MDSPNHSDHEDEGSRRPADSRGIPKSNELFGSKPLAKLTSEMVREDSCLAIHCPTKMSMHSSKSLISNSIPIPR